jgi:hypothetical protein
VGYKIVSFGTVIDADSQVYPTFGLGWSWANYSYSETQGKGPVHPGIYFQGSVSSLGLAVNETLNLLHPTAGFMRETGWATPNASIGIQVVGPKLVGTTPRDWAYHPDNPERKGLMWHPVGRCPY